MTRNGKNLSFNASGLGVDEAFKRQAVEMVVRGGSSGQLKPIVTEKYGFMLFFQAILL
jgi:hypothetical protein